MTELFSRMCVWIVSSAIVLSLSDGMSSFNGVCDSHLNADTSNDSGVYKDIRELIVRAQQDMEKTEREAVGALRELDADTENLTAEQMGFEKEQEEKKRILDNLNIQLNSEKQSLKFYEQGLHSARNLQQNAEGVLNTERERLRKAKSRRDAGIGVSFIPFIGTVIAGPIIAVSGAKEMEQAERAIRDAKEEVYKSKSDVQHYYARISDCKSRISNIEYAIRQTYEDLKRTEEKVVEVKRQREALAESQEKMRRDVHFLGRLSGTANKLELQTRLCILPEPVMKLMENLVKVAGEIPGNQILRDKGLMSLVDAMRENIKRLAAVCVSCNSQENHN